MKEGVYPELSNEDYHRDTAIGSSGLRIFKDNPALYYAAYVDPRGINERKETANQALGSHAHVALLEPEKFENDYLVSPKEAIVNKGKKNEDIKPMNKAHGDWDVFVEECKEKGKKPILWKDYEDAFFMTAQIMNDPLAKACLSGKGKNECSFFVKDKNTGLMRKSRPDRIVDLQGLGGYRYVIVDYKTTGLSIDLDTQSRYAYGDSERFIQAGCHSSVVEELLDIKIDAVVYITQMQKWPHLVQCFVMPNEDIELGKAIMNETFTGYTDENGVYKKGLKECMHDNIWPSYTGGIKEYVRPSWFMYKYARLLGN